MYDKGVQLATDTKIKDMREGIGYLISLGGYKSEDGADIAIISRSNKDITVKWMVFDKLVYEKINESLRKEVPHYLIYLDNREYINVIRKATLSLKDLQGVYGLSDLDMEQLSEVLLTHFFLCVVLWISESTYAEKVGI